MFAFHDDIQSCLEVLRQGGLILYPTDTVWGIGCDATNEAAVKQIYRLKNRMDSKALIVLVANEVSILNYVDMPALKIFDYIKGIHKPTTVIYQNAKQLPKNLVATDGSIAIRICNDFFCKTLIEQFGKPIVSTSANVSTYPTPLCFQDISIEIKQGVHYIVKHRQEETTMQQPSSIIKWEPSGEINIIRH